MIDEIDIPIFWGGLELWRSLEKDLILEYFGLALSAPDLISVMIDIARVTGEILIIEEFYKFQKDFRWLKKVLSRTILLTQVLTNTLWMGEVVFRSILLLKLLSQLLRSRLKNAYWRTLRTGSSWYGRMLTSRVSVAQLD